MALAAIAVFSTHERFIFDYQTLMGGIIALVGAVLTVFIVLYQTRKTVDIAQDALNRKSVAARAALPAELTLIAEYAEECVDWLVGALACLQASTQGTLTSTQGTPAIGNLPVFPSKPLLALKECIEFADTDSARYMVNVIAFAQILNSRLKYAHSGLTGSSQHIVKIITRDTIYQRVADSIHLHALIYNMFKYARQHTDSPPSSPNADDAHRSVRLLHADTLFTDIDATIGGMYEGTSYKGITL